MIRPLALAPVLCVALVALTAPATASAGRGCHSQVTSTTYLMELQGSHGYPIKIESFPNGRVALTTEKGNLYADYAVNGRSDERGLEADFGALGRIAVHFHRPGPGVFHSETVRLEGKIEFHGDEGFTSLSLTHAKGAVFRRFKRVCAATRGRVPARAARASVLKRSASRAVTTVAAAEHTPSRTVLVRLQSSQPPLLGEDGGGDDAVVILEERRERIYILRIAVLDPLTEGVTVSPSGAEPLSGSVVLPPPFSGTAAFSRPSGSITSWSGNLTASLPGASNVPLTGPGFTAVACSGKEDTGRLEGCEEELGKLVEASWLRQPSVFP
jgi:hypothetical protein